jgi:hypothetical protein
VFAVVIALALAEVLRAAGAGGLRALAASPYVLYFAAAAAVLVATLGKVGSGTNYVFETVLAALLWLVFSARRLLDAAAPRRVWVAIALLCAAAAADLAWTPRRAISFTDPVARRSTATALARMASEIRALGNPEPKILNLANARLSYPLPGEIAVNDPYLYSLLWQVGPTVRRSWKRCAAAMTRRHGAVCRGAPDAESALESALGPASRPIRLPVRGRTTFGRCARPGDVRDEREPERAPAQPGLVIALARVMPRPDTHLRRHKHPSRRACPRCRGGGPRASRA